MSNICNNILIIHMHVSKMTIKFMKITCFKKKIPLWAVPCDWFLKETWIYIHIHYI